jgi:hypothetical protein
MTDTRIPSARPVPMAPPQIVISNQRVDNELDTSRAPP